MVSLKRILFPTIPLLFSILSLLLVSLFLYRSPTKGNKYQLQLNFVNANFTALYQVVPPRDVTVNDTYIQDIYNIGFWGYNAGTTGNFNKVNGTRTIKRYRFDFNALLDTNFKYSTLSSNEALFVGGSTTSITADTTNNDRSWSGIYGGFIMSIITLIFAIASYILQFFSSGALFIGILALTVGLNIGQFILLLIGMLYTRDNVDALYNDFKTRQAILGVVAKKGTLSAGWAAMCFSLFAFIAFFVWLVYAIVAKVRGHTSFNLRGGRRRAEKADNSSFTRAT